MGSLSGGLIHPFQELIELFFTRNEILYVSSSNVLWIRYYQDRDVLLIGYRNNAAYAYSGVTATEAASLLFAPSKGTWVWDRIRVRGKGNSRRTRKVFSRL